MIKFNIIKSLYHSLFVLMISIIFLFLFPFNIVEISYGQSITFETESETAVTSYIDALFKAPTIDFPSFSSRSQFCTLLFIYSHYKKRTNIFQ